MNTKPAASGTVQFVDAHGATVVIDRDNVHQYAGVRAEQLAALTKITAEASVGGGDVDKSLVDIMLLWSSELADAMESLIELVHECAKGGAAE